MDLLAFFMGLKNSLIAAVVFIGLERIIPKEPKQKILRPNWANDLVYLVFNRWFIGQGIALLILLIVTHPIVPASLRRVVATQSLWIQIPALLVIADLTFYLVHRTFHAVPMLWRFHQVHHSIEHMDWLAGYRVHPIDQILTKGGSLLPCIALGFSANAFAVYGMIYFTHSVLLHSNVRISFGPLRWLIASPQFHHWHHSREPEAWDKNFAGELSLIDIVFGTAHMPKGQWTPSYGIHDDLPRTYVGQLAYPFLRIATGRAVPDAGTP